MDTTSLMFKIKVDWFSASIFFLPILVDGCAINIAPYMKLLASMRKHARRTYAVHYQNPALCRVREALGKRFTKYDTRQRSLGELYISNDVFADYFLSGTRQILCGVPLSTRPRKVAVTASGDGDRDYIECHGDTRQKLYLCRVSTVPALSKEAPRGSLSYFSIASRDGIGILVLYMEKRGGCSICASLS
jgi:hypothetical protein